MSKNMKFSQTVSVLSKCMGITSFFCSISTYKEITNNDCHNHGHRAQRLSYEIIMLEIILLKAKYIFFCFLQ